MSDVTLLTGFPSFHAQRLLRRLLESDPAERAYLLTSGRFQLAAEIFVSELPRQARARVEVLVGDPAAMDLGLPGGDYRRLCGALTAIHSLFGVARGRRRDREREGAGPHPLLAATRNLIDLSRECPGLRRLCHHSTTAVAGTRTGVVLEEDLDLGQRFAHRRDEAHFQAEQALQQACRARPLPVTVLRTAPLVGDSRTGEMDRFAGPYALLRAILRSKAVVPRLLQLPGVAESPVHLCPIDFAVEAALWLARDARASGVTCHLGDPNPLPVRVLVELMLGHGAGGAPLRLPRAVSAMFRAPGVERLARAPLSFLEEGMGRTVFYGAENTTRLLAGTGLFCPPLRSYLQRLLDYMQRTQADSAVAGEEEEDPLG